MSYKSQAQAGYFHTHKKQLEKQGVDVSEWDSATKGKHLPKRAQAGGSINRALSIARRHRDDGGDVGGDEISAATSDNVGVAPQQSVAQNFGPAGNADQGLLDASQAQREVLGRAAAVPGQFVSGLNPKAGLLSQGGPKMPLQNPARANDNAPRATGGTMSGVGRAEHALRLARHMAQAGTVDFTGQPGASAMGQMFEGPIRTKGAGRTDVNKHDVASGSYVVPADAVSITGDGNTESGFGFWKSFFKPIDLTGGMKVSSQPMKASGVKKPGINLAPPHAPPHAQQGNKKAEGGVDGGSGPVPIIDAGGEVVVPPRLIEAKFGSLDHGHETMDEIVKLLREQEIERLKSAPPPKK